MTDPISTEEVREYEAIKNEVRQQNFKRSQLELILRAYIAFGLATAIAALGFFGFSFLEIDLTLEQRMALIVAGAGASVAIMSAILLTFRRQQLLARSETFRTAELGYGLVRGWSKFEELSRRVLEERGIEFNARSPRSIVSTLESNKLIDPSLGQDIRSALDIRNRVVHQAEAIPRQEVLAANRILDASNDRLTLVLQQTSDGI